MRIQGLNVCSPSALSNKGNELSKLEAAKEATIEEASKNAARLTTDENGDSVGYGSVYKLEGVEFVVPEGYDSIEQYLDAWAAKPARPDPYTDWDPYEAREKSNTSWLNTDFEAEYTSTKDFVKQAFDYFLDTTQSQETLMAQHSQMLDTLSGPINDTTTFTIGNVSLSLKDLKTIAQIYQKNNNLIVESIDKGLQENWGSQAVYSTAFAATQRDIATSLGFGVSKMTADSLQKTYEDRINARHNPFWWQDLTREAIEKYGSPEAARDARLAAQGITSKAEDVLSNPTEKTYFQGHWGDIANPHSFYADLHKQTISMDVSNPSATKKSVRDLLEWTRNGFTEEARISIKYWGVSGWSASSQVEQMQAILSHFGF